MRRKRRRLEEFVISETTIPLSSFSSVHTYDDNVNSKIQEIKERQASNITVPFDIDPMSIEMTNIIKNYNLSDISYIIQESLVEYEKTRFNLDSRESNIVSNLYDIPIDISDDVFYTLLTKIIDILSNLNQKTHYKEDQDLSIYNTARELTIEFLEQGISDIDIIYDKLIGISLNIKSNTMPSLIYNLKKSEEIKERKERELIIQSNKVIRNINKNENDRNIISKVRDDIIPREYNDRVESSDVYKGIIIKF